eukprot:ANDGO_01196.mRNA.1 hypothetical protein
MEEMQNLLLTIFSSASIKGKRRLPETYATVVSVFLGSLRKSNWLAKAPESFIAFLVRRVADLLQNLNADTDAEIVFRATVGRLPVPADRRSVFALLLVSSSDAAADVRIVVRFFFPFDRGFRELCLESPNAGSMLSLDMVSFYFRKNQLLNTESWKDLVRLCLRVPRTASQPGFEMLFSPTFREPIIRTCFSQESFVTVDSTNPSERLHDIQMHLIVEGVRLSEKPDLFELASLAWRLCELYTVTHPLPTSPAFLALMELVLSYPINVLIAPFDRALRSSCIRVTTAEAFLRGLCIHPWAGRLAMVSPLLGSLVFRAATLAGSEAWIARVNSVSHLSRVLQAVLCACACQVLEDWFNGTNTFLSSSSSFCTDNLEILLSGAVPFEMAISSLADFVFSSIGSIVLVSPPAGLTFVLSGLAVGDSVLWPMNPQSDDVWFPFCSLGCSLGFFPTDVTTVFRMAGNLRPLFQIPRDPGVSARAFSRRLCLLVYSRMHNNADHAQYVFDALLQRIGVNQENRQMLCSEQIIRSHPSSSHLWKAITERPCISIWILSCLLVLRHSNARNLWQKVVWLLGDYARNSPRIDPCISEIASSITLVYAIHHSFSFAASILSDLESLHLAAEDTITVALALPLLLDNVTLFRRSIASVLIPRLKAASSVHPVIQRLLAE